jgi:xanthine dehydrogenase YagR molybdenum-binding subunit
MAEYKWPDAAQRKVIGTRHARVDGPDKSSGRAKYTYDATPPGLLAGAILRSPHAHARLISVDTSAAEKMPGVKAVAVLQKPGSATIRWAGDEVVAVAAVNEGTAADALSAIKVRWEPLPHFVDDFSEPPTDLPEDTGPLSLEDLTGMFSNQVPEVQMAAAINKRGIDFPVTPELLKRAQGGGAGSTVVTALQKAQVKPASTGPKVPYHPTQATVTGTPDEAFKSAAAVSEGIYGVPTIAHCCMESHGAVAMWSDPEHLDVQISTQSVSDMPGQVSDGLKNYEVAIPPTNIHMHQQHMGGGFGSKFSADRWSSAAALLSKKAGGAPVKIMLDRRAELEVAGARPSAYARVKVAADKDGKLVAWDSRSWSTGGPTGGGAMPVPYVFRDIPNLRTQHTSVDTNTGPSRAWRAPNHPQAAALTMTALEDLAAKLNMDPYDLILRNLDLTQRAKEYRDELPIADQLMGWKKRWHPRGDKTQGPIKRGLGLSIHTWGGRGHESHCDLTIHSDGAVEMKMATQDLGTGTRTSILMVISESLGIPVEAITLKIGDTNYPQSGGSGGSTTIGGVSSAARRAAVDAINALYEKIAPVLGTTPEHLESANGQVRIKGGGNGLTWKQACAKLGPAGITTQGVNWRQPTRNKPDLTNAGVGGVQMADVSVDTETGIVRVNKMVAVQDCGLVVNLKTAESQVHGALIMGISYALFEERVMDPGTGRMLNSNFEFYRLAGYGDIPDLVVHMMTGPGYDERGVIGLGEPPVISPGASISNAVANAIGVRVPFLPLTPNRVLTALNANSSAGLRPAVPPASSRHNGGAA